MERYKKSFRKMFDTMEYYLKQAESGGMNKSSWDKLASKADEFEEGFEADLFEALVNEIERVSRKM